MTAEIRNKINFVQKLNDIVWPVQSNIERIQYKVFRNKKIPSHYYELLVIEYVGGATTVRKSNGNSCSAIFADIAKYLDHGYYEEVSLLRDLQKDDDWEEEV